ncbi:hypothetical protein [Roseovarius sp. MMSF_3281]|uniref:hypothetical protein n=1 Tax=Roseovarius sp. MMSF_3281 TaxID=3046694 RepID=UPI00273D44F0|nr:hypothetical protein [Roseovarius sp. MMSF_3281]
MKVRKAMHKGVQWVPHDKRSLDIGAPPACLDTKTAGRAAWPAPGTKPMADHTSVA